MTAPLLRVPRPLIRLTQPGSVSVPPGNRSDFGVLFSGVSTLSPFDGISGAGQRNGSHPSYVAPNGYGYGEQYPTGSTYASGFWLPQFKPAYAAVGSSLLWHGRITANSASYPYIAGKWQTPSVGGNYTGQFYLMVSTTGYIGVQIHRGASGVSTLYTSLQMPIGSPVTVLLNFRSDGVDVVTSLGREFLSLSGIGDIGSAVAAYGVTIGAPGSGFTGHPYARTGLLAWSTKTLPDSVVRNPWQIFAPRKTHIFVPLGASGGSQTLAPSLYTNSSTPYAPTVSAGVVTLAPGIYTDSQTFYSPTVSLAGGAQQLTANRVDNASVFYSPLLAPGAVTVAPSLYNNSQTFYSLTLSASKTLLAGLFTNSQAFYAPIVSLGSGPQIVAPPLFSNTQSYFTHAVSTGQVVLFPILFNNTQAFFSPVVAAPGVMTLTQADIDAIVSALSVAMLPVNAVKIRGATVIGNGTPNDPWRNADTGKRPYIK